MRPKDQNVTSGTHLVAWKVTIKGLTRARPDALASPRGTSSMPPEDALILADENESPQLRLASLRGVAGLSSPPRDSHSVSMTAFLWSSRAL